MITQSMERIRVAGVEVSPNHYIGGKRVSSESTFQVISPIDESVLGEVAAGSQHEVDLAVQAAKNAFPAWAALGPKGRGNYLKKLANIIEANIEKLAIVETTNNGSLFESSRLRVMKRGAHNIRFFAEWAEQLKGEIWESNGVRYSVHYEPSGVSGLITPWNAPFMLTTWKVGPALAAGNTVVIKPPEWAPFTCSLLADFAEEAGIPPGVLNVVQGIGEQAGAALTNHSDVNRISFTGSEETGRIIGKAAADRIVPVSLELGGKSPLIIFADCDFESALRTAIGQYDNAGQVCLAGTRILVEESIAEKFLERLKTEASKIVLGDPRKPETQVGPLITREHLERVQGFVEGTKATGAELAYGGFVSEKLGGLYFEPTLFVNIPNDAEILKKEVFGPVLTFQTFKTEEEAIEMANNTEYGLAATIFTGDEQRAERVGHAVNAGTVWVNTFFARDLSAPFGGSKKSGIGREGGNWSFEFFCDVKTLSKRNGSFQ
ncbi:betaine-aldehyde dehydrogenase [Neobacillus massiliamazoniensis]|uniref:Aldehyde dehydrogenase n=2 Tax=Neobacillus massiliamazoniensis TaxID=1499688 RepID=A0A0U1P0I8_9BACI|nr:betaine-aldehyde dehydrogenase [Neobacillus massiliamazoniensis]